MAKNNNLQDFLTDVANSIRTKTGTTEQINAQDFSSKIESIETGITPSGKKTITSTAETDVTNFATAQVVDSNLVASNIKKNVSILGITGTLEEGITPTGTLDITTNGIVDVTNYEKANVNVPSGGGNTLKNLLDTTQSTRYMFSDYKGTSVDNLIQPDDTENVTDMDHMFFQCSNLTTIPLLNTSNVTDMNYMFNNSINLNTIPLLDTSNVTDMNNMFGYCQNLTTMPLINTSKVTNMYAMFYYCKNLTAIPMFDTSNVGNMGHMFTGCTKLTTIPALDVSKVTQLNNIFLNCSNLKSILMTNIGVNLNIASSTKFERSDLLVILNNLKTVAKTTTLAMGADNLAKLTEEDKAIATNKGWTLS